MAIRRKKKRNRKESTRELIVSEAEALIARYGIDGLRLDAISESLGIQRPSLYTHFDGREGILRTIAEKGLAGLGKQFPFDERKDAIAQISSGVRDLVLYLQKNVAFVRLFMSDLATPAGLEALSHVLGPPERMKNPQYTRPLFARIQKIINLGVSHGKFRKMQAPVFLSILLGTVMFDQAQHRRKMKDPENEMVDLAHRILTARPPFDPL
jgi:AcrR family transcriptional regulator